MPMGLEDTKTFIKREYTFYVDFGLDVYYIIQDEERNQYEIYDEQGNYMFSEWTDVPKDFLIKLIDTYLQGYDNGLHDEWMRN